VSIASNKFERAWGAVPGEQRREQELSCSSQVMFPHVPKFRSLGDGPVMFNICSLAGTSHGNGSLHFSSTPFSGTRIYPLGHLQLSIKVLPRQPAMEFGGHCMHENLVALPSL